MEQITENNNNHIIMHIERYYNSTICAKTGTFCSRNRRICSHYPVLFQNNKPITAAYNKLLFANH